MKKLCKVWGIIAAGALIGVALMSCGDAGDPSSPAPGVKSIAVTPATPNVGKGATQQFTATATYDNNATGVVTPTWSVAATSGAKHANTEINASGLLTIAPLESAAGLIVTASYGGQNGMATVTVTAAVAVTGVTIIPGNTTLGAGTKKFTATVTPANAPQTVTWSLPLAITGVTLSNDGLLTIPAAGLTANATFTILATSTANADITRSVTITYAVNAAPALLAAGAYSTGTPADVDIHYSLGAGGSAATAIDRVRIGANNAPLSLNSDYTVDASAKILTIKKETLAAVVAGAAPIAFDVRFDDAAQTVDNTTPINVTQ
jgi:hypothetical protein